MLPSAVHLADILVSTLGIGIGRDGLQYSIDPFALEKLGLSENDLDGLLDQVATLMKEAEAMINP